MHITLFTTQAIEPGTLVRALAVDPRDGQGYDVYGLVDHDGATDLTVTYVGSPTNATAYVRGAVSIHTADVVRNLRLAADALA